MQNDRASVKDLVYLQQKKANHKPITMITCYDFPTAQMLEEAGIDIVFVGDSVGTNILGYSSETEVTMEDMVHHLKAVRRGIRDAYLLVDLPFGSYTTPENALNNAVRLLEHGANGIKLEGGIEQCEVVRTLADADIEVCGHIGFTPQTLGSRGRIQGRTLQQGKDLLRSALALEASGLSMLVLELVSDPISRLITNHLRIPTIGIGSGQHCDGQVLVLTDLLGISSIERKLARRYEHLRERTLNAFKQYAHDVENRIFPDEHNTFNKLTEEEAAQLAIWVEQGMPEEG